MKKIRCHLKKGLLCSLCIFLFFASRANIRLPAVISGSMVLQQLSTVRLWGWCEPGEKVYITTSWDHKVDSVMGTRDGNFQFSLSTPGAGGGYTIDFSGKNRIVLENVMIGEVWICSGQSNMEMSGDWRLPDIKAELPDCATNNIHFFHVPKTTSAYPQDDCKAQWTACDSSELKKFSAVAYYFGKKLNKELNVPIGLIECAWGGTPAEVWTPAELVKGDDELKNAAEHLEISDGWPSVPGVCYNGMLAPLASFTIAGAIWYQGESNTGTAGTYSRLFKTMIGSWRKAWNKPLPFYYVQIAPFTYEKANEGALLREQQARSMGQDHTGMVVISDLVDDTTDIHPKNKHDVGLRLANWALGDWYHRDGAPYRSPLYKSSEVKGDKMLLQFDNEPNGLVVKGDLVKTLTIAGEDKLFYPARAIMEGGRLIVSARAVKKPVAVRYQFSNAGIGNLFSKEGLPVAPFRTDDWATGSEK